MKIKYFLIIHDADLVNEKLEKSNLSLSSQIKSGFKNTIYLSLVH